MPMTNKEWLDIKLEEVRESGGNIGEDYVEALTRLEEEIHEKDKLEKDLNEIKEMIEWANKEVCDIRSLYAKFHRTVKPLA